MHGSKFTVASRGFSATAWLLLIDCIVLCNQLCMLSNGIYEPVNELLRS